MRGAVALRLNRIFRTFGAGLIGRQEAKLEILQPLRLPDDV
jgi:hypothetical protein